MARCERPIGRPENALGNAAKRRPRLHGTAGYGNEGVGIMAEPMTDERFAEIERLAHAATPGPLLVEEGSCLGEESDRWSVMADRGDKHFFVATIENGAPGDTLETEKANAGLFAASHEMVAEIKRLREELAEREASFDLRWNADMRAIRMWQEAHPGNDNVWPSHDDLCVWLMEQLDQLKKDAPAGS